eukprot:scaffold35793_cov124-Isochrysis_galbana.AAC.5
MKDSPISRWCACCTGSSERPVAGRRGRRSAHLRTLNAAAQTPVRRRLNLETGRRPRGLRKPKSG